MNEHPTTPEPTPTDVEPVHTPLLWSLLGLRRRRGRWLHVRPTAWGWTLLAVIVVFGGGIVFAEYSMQPDFCRSCHIMEPYYQAWHESTHNGILCGDCHFEPGWQNTIKGKFEASSQAVKYITNTYGSKPHAEVRDASCLREGCHAERLLAGRADWTTSTARGAPITIQFDHTPHIQEMRRGKRLRCVSCHSQMVQGRHIAVTLETCYTCHFKGLKHGRDEEVIGGCSSCHSAPKDEIRLATGVFKHSDYVERGVACFNCHSDSIRGDGEVPRQMCWNCHNNPQQIARYGEAGHVHEIHVTENKVECSACHVQIEHQIDAAIPRASRALGEGHMLENAGTCAQCHEKTHIGPAEMYQGTGGRGVPDMPSPMFRAQVDCIACHQEHRQSGEVATVAGQTFVAAQTSCDMCHGNRYEDSLDNWRQTIDQLAREAEIEVERARQRLAGPPLPPEQALEARRLLDDAEHNLRFVRFGHGVHNLNYATALLNVAIENSRRVATEFDADSAPTDPQR
ncbi:MAG: NapC/NirT family cytochrome c [Planctomycetota bacterium]|jgi:nitrate/TMAO reductase-like tetraheme cytochrome c subunit